jgi:predicted Zn-dependent peptidase
MNVRQSKTSNGVRVATSSNPHVESVTLGIWIGVGSRYEPVELGGISHFTEHLLFKGTKRRSPRDISQAIEGRGGYLNAFTGEEATCYYARVGYDQLNSAFDVLGDMYMNSRFDRKEIEKERGVIFEEIMMYRDQPRHLVQEMLMGILWPEHPLGRPIIGTHESLSAMTRKSFTDFVGSKYVTNNTVVSFAGNLEHEACVDLVEKSMGKATRASRARFTPVGDKQGQGRTSFFEKDVEQTHLALGFRCFGYNDERRHVLRLLNTILGENMSSRLFQIVREKHGLAYSVHSSMQLFRDSGALVIAAGLDRQRKTKALDLIVKEVGRMVERPVGVAELKRAKDYVIGQTRLGLESTSHQMMWLGDNLLSRGRFVSPEETIKKLREVTAADIQKLAKQIFKHTRASLAVVSPGLSKQDQATMRTSLKNL